MKRVLGDNWALPALDALNRAFFTSGALTLQSCSACGHFQHPPEEVCLACQSFELGAFTSAGKGKVESVAVAHHPVHPALAGHTPYAIVVVSVDDAPGVFVIGNAVGVAPDGVRIGDAVRVVFEEAQDPKSGEQFRIPQWEVTR
jgi:uncharacterized OB-fold protein